MTSNKPRGSFIFYRSFIDTIRLLSAEQAKELILAIGDFALDYREIELSDNLKPIWIAIRAQLESNREKYENGKKGGAPKGSKNNPFGRRGKPSKEANHATTSEKTSNNVFSKEIPPIECVSKYIAQHKLHVNAESFINYYKSIGWKRNGQPIEDWTPILKSWHDRHLQQNSTACAKETLGPGEYTDKNGNRTYDDGVIIVPNDAPVRPSPAYWWNRHTMSWDNAI